jgi:hypothetical protein
MGLFSGGRSEASGGHTGSPPAVTDWSNIESIKAEWPRSELDPEVDLQRYRQALQLYERDDYPSMMECANLMAMALAHSLYGRGILRGDDLVNTLHKTLYCALCAPPDGRTFAESAQKALRLALTIIRENNWQPPGLGGSFAHFEPMMMDNGNYMLLSTAIAPPNEPWGGNLTKFFSVPPVPSMEPLPTPEVDLAKATAQRVNETMREAEQGDSASNLYLAGLGMVVSGDTEGAYNKCVEAAGLGSVDAMAEAAALAARLGRAHESQLWWEVAAKAGHPIGLFNMGIAAYQHGDRATAAQLLQRATEAGNVEGFAALVQMADEAGDEGTEAHWAQLGAEAGHLFCMARHGLLLARSADGDVPTMRRARDFLEQAAERGHIDSAGLAVSLNLQLGDRPQAQKYITLVVQSGDAEAIDRLRRYGFMQ